MRTVPRRVADMVRGRGRSSIPLPSLTRTQSKWSRYPVACRRATTRLRRNVHLTQLIYGHAFAYHEPAGAILPRALRANERRRAARGVTFARAVHSRLEQLLV